MRLGSYLVDLRPLRLPAFRRLWTASALTAIGGSFSLVAVPTQLFALTGSSAYVGLAAAVSMATLIAAALGAGVIADVADRRTVLLAGNACLGLAYLGLWLDAVAGLNSVPLILALVGVQGIGFGAAQTTTGAAVPRVVPAGLLAAASSLSSLTRYTGAVVGPLLAGVLLPRTGFGPLYLTDALVLTVLLWAVARLPRLLPAPARQRFGVADGFQHLARSRLLVAVLAVDLAAMVLGMPSVLYPELAERTYGGAPGGGIALSLLYAAYPAGVLLAGLVSGTFTRTRRHGALMASAALAWGGCVIALGLTTDLRLGVVALVAGGAANMVLSTTRNALTQAHAEDALLGRMQGSLVVVLMGGPQLGNVLHGTLGAAIGARATIAAGGLATVLAVVLVVRAAPQLWRYDAGQPAARVSRRAGRGAG